MMKSDTTPGCENRIICAQNIGNACNATTRP
jgi:hypothetical protein